MIVCSPRYFTPPIDSLQYIINESAKENPANAMLIPKVAGLKPQHIAIMRSNYWGKGGAANLTVGFMDNPDNATKTMILKYANLWRKHANIKFVESNTSPVIRIARERDGYWSYLGTDVKQIPKNQPTMNLEGFTSKSDPRECMRVIPHEFGHTLGMPHEHMRKAIVDRIDQNKAIAYFKRTQGWSASMVRQQVLTPLEESSLLMNRPELTSIMCYQLPGEIMKDGQPVPGGDKITDSDHDLVRKVYPRL